MNAGDSRRRRGTSTGAAVFVAALAAATSGLVGCASPPSPGPASRASVVDTATVVADVTAFLRASAGDWNRDDLDAFMATYADEVITFVGGEEVVRSKDEIRANYERSYFGTDGEPPDLRFSAIEVRPLGDTHALAFGRWTLYTPGFEEQPVQGSGWFSLVLERRADGWRIVHDHSS